MLIVRLWLTVVSIMVVSLFGLLTGCGFKDIDKRFFVVTVGVDKPEKKGMNYKVELKLAIPSSSERFGSNNSLIVTEEAETVTEAVRLIKSKVDKELDFGHTKAVIFGDSLMNEPNALKEVMDWFTRRRDIQMITWMGLGRPDALAVLRASPKTERLPANQLFMFFGQTGTESAYIVSEYLFDLRRRMRERGLDPVLPIVQAREADQLTVNKTAVFNKERRVLNLSPDETKIFNTFFHNIGKTDVKVNNGSQTFAISMDSIKTKYSCRKDANGKDYVYVTIAMTGILEEARASVDLKLLTEYERLAEKELSTRAGDLFRKLQKAGVDPIGFGLDYRAHRMTEQAEWERWEAEYPEIEFRIDAKVKLLGAGVIE
jgi:spore germination protein KC